LYQVLKEQVQVQVPDVQVQVQEQVLVVQVQVQVLKFKYKYKYKYCSRNSQVQIAHLITYQFVTVYNQVNFINQTSNEIACFAISSLFVGRHCTNKCDNEQLSTVLLTTSLGNKYFSRKYKYKYKYQVQQVC